MKKPNKVFILICLVLTVTIFIFYNNSPLANESNIKITETDGIKEANEILEKIHETNLAFQIEEALKKNNYSPHGTIAFQIYSSDKQYATILMENLDLQDKDTLKNIQKIVNTVAKANDFNLFVVDIQKVNK